MKQIYRRTPMPKCDAKQPYWNHTSAWVFSVKFATYFQNTFSWEHLWVTASDYLIFRIPEDHYSANTESIFCSKFEVK